MESQEEGIFFGRAMFDVALDPLRFGLAALLAQLRRLAAVLGFSLFGLGGLLLGDLFLSSGLHVRRQFERPLAAAARERAGKQRRDC